MSNHRSNQFFYYPRDKQGKRTGQTIAVIVRERKAFLGYALCSSEDQFNRVEGRKLSLERANESYKRFLVKHGLVEKENTLAGTVVTCLHNIFNTGNKVGE